MSTNLGDKRVAGTMDQITNHPLSKESGNIRSELYSLGPIYLRTRVLII